ncbi:hypothetical protein [Thomasclavelia cocleata]|uniref:hypothetical protein n=1 Tax=Thomasclavelia cocleata TaxID=69824 RepID=UPI0025910DEA|nr:hypothetical protein [Thomasclavelia cocleata]
MIDKELMELVESVQQLYEQAFMICFPIVEELCNRNDVSQKELEHELEGMLSFCQSDDMLNLFKKLCRKFYKQYPETVASYIMTYKELYGE